MAGAECTEALDRLFEYIDHELPEDEVQRIGTHLKSCPPCEAEHQIKEKIKALTARTGGEKAPEELRNRILESLRAVREDA
ncbi:mycothiol system anti-sigma-R factor [Demequina globuliformis]|uniref:mycothiol system anti-sigma-R factor n=1 Tax=Demequina globuliformis TaxID=676202 RepID=UPI0007818EE2|nr:mycothiol system anti-sigma-R factor [Demequina globuliformis]